MVGRCTLNSYNSITAVNFCSLQITIHHQSQIGYNCGNGVGAVHYLQSASGESLGSPRT